MSGKADAAMKDRSLAVNYEADLIWYDGPQVIGCGVPGADDVVLGLALPDDPDAGFPMLFTRISEVTWKALRVGDVDLRSVFTEHAASDLMWADIADTSTADGTGRIVLQPLGRTVTEDDLPEPGEILPFEEDWRPDGPGTR